MLALAARILHVDVSRIHEAGLPREHFNVVARELGLRNVDLGPDHMLNAEGKVGHRDLFLDSVVHTVDRLIMETREVDHRFPHGLAGDGAGVDANAAEHLPLFNQCHFLAGFGRLDCGPLARWPGTDNDQVVGLHAVPVIFLYP